MIRKIYICLFFIILGNRIIADNEQVVQAQIASLADNRLIEVAGQATNGLQPFLLVGMDNGEWSIEIYYKAQTNFKKYTWLNINEFVGSKLRLFLTNGLEINATNADALDAIDLPKQTTVSNITWGFKGPSSQRGLQWLQTKLGEKFPAKLCNLKGLFNVSYTNDVVLDVTPLMYEVQSDGVAARLVEFPEMKIKLLRDGAVQKLKPDD